MSLDEIIKCNKGSSSMGRGRGRGRGGNGGRGGAGGRGRNGDVGKGKSRSRSRGPAQSRGGGGFVAKVTLVRRLILNFVKDKAEVLRRGSPGHAAGDRSRVEAVGGAEGGTGARGDCGGWRARAPSCGGPGPGPGSGDSPASATAPRTRPPSSSSPTSMSVCRIPTSRSCSRSSGSSSPRLSTTTGTGGVLARRMWCTRDSRIPLKVLFIVISLLPFNFLPWQP